ncbi:MAG: UPF0175 family protein [Methylomonas sp.]|jgi:predicted HTH domain antitoxin
MPVTKNSRSSSKVCSASRNIASCSGLTRKLSRVEWEAAFFTIFIAAITDRRDSVNIMQTTPSCHYKDSTSKKIMTEKYLNISFSVNADILLSLKENTEEFTQDLRFFSALMWYGKQRLSLGKAAELAGYSKLDFIERLKLEKEAVFDYSPEEMAEVFADVDKLP